MGFHRRRCLRNNTNYTGNIQITNNTIQCAANGNNCVLLESAGSTVSGNTITATGSATGLYVAAPGASVTGNTFQMGTGTGILLYAPPVDAATVTGNKLNGTGRVGIYVRTPPARAAGGGDEVKRSPSATGIYNNTITGFAIPLDAPSARLGPTNILRKNLR